MAFTVREYKRKDLPRLKDMIDGLVGHSGSILPGELKQFEELEDREKAVDHAAGLGRRRGWKCFVCENDGKPVGFIAGRVENEMPGYRIRKYGKVEMFFVEPAFRRRGAGRSLMSRMEHWFMENDCGGTAVETWAENRAALMAYERMGFREMAVTLVKKTGR